MVQDGISCEFQQIVSFVNLLECDRVVSAEALLNELVEGLLSPRWFKAKQNGFHLPVLNCGARRTSQEIELHVLFLTAESHSVVLVEYRLCHRAAANQ